jgi:hypothetical protein
VNGAVGTAYGHEGRMVLRACVEEGIAALASCFRGRGHPPGVPVQHGWESGASKTVVAELLTAGMGN